MITSPIVLRDSSTSVRQIVYNPSLPANIKEIITKAVDSGTENSIALLRVGQRLVHLEKKCSEFVLNDNVTSGHLKEADLVISDRSYIGGILLSRYFNKPNILVLTTTFTVAAHSFRVPMPQSYVPVYFNRGATENMNFIQRVSNVFGWLLMDAVIEGFAYAAYGSFREQYSINPREYYDDLVGRTEIVLVQLDFVTEFVHPLMPNVFYVGPLMPKPASPLPHKYETYVQGSGENGIVLVAFGTHRSQLPEYVVVNMLTAFGKLKQRIIWKAELPDNVTVPNNVKLVSWMPQNDILGHPKTRAFVSHGGLNSLQEAAYHGVPVLSAPFIGDGSENSVRFEKKAKMALRIDMKTASLQDWVNAIREVIYNSSYKENALKTSKLLRSHRRSPVQRSGDLIEYVINNDFHVPHLRAHAFNLTWYEYHLIDVYAFLAFVGVLLLYVTYRFFKCVVNLVCGEGKKKKD